MKRLILILTVLLGTSLHGQQDKIIVDVSVAPFAFFVQQIGGEWVEPVSLVPPGASPHSYEPSPNQVRRALKAKIWFRIGEPFEEKMRPSMERAEVKIVDLRRGLQLIAGSCPHCRHGEDLHFWLSPKEAETFSRTIADALEEVLPEHQEKIEENLARLEIALKELDQQLKQEIAPCQGGAIVVSHPAFGYFCRDYGITQLSVEVEGKEGALRHLAELIVKAREMGVQRVILQQQYSTKGAKLVAKELGIPTCTIDPYLEHYFEVMTRLAECVCPS